MSPLLIGILAFVGVATLVGGAVLLFAAPPASKLEDRLDVLTGTGAAAMAAKDGLLKDNSVLARPLDDAPTMLAQWFAHFGNFDLLFEQADTTMTVGRLAIFSAVLAVGGAAVTMAMKAPAAMAPLAAIVAGSLPILWVWWRRKRRLNTFNTQLPDALEMMARALRAGQSLAFGFNAVASEMPMPIGKEFGRIFDEQNLGVALDDSLRAMCERVPNLDLRFFVTAVILQRQTGGDLSEILDKIGSLIRSRFRILGQVKAQTGEGRLSGIVLMALPLLLFVIVYNLNPAYVTQLFTDPAGKKMLAVAIFMQILGAIVIKKIVEIKV
jgi:tight adherence protein B